jgi:hypothetical protein
MYKHKKYRKNQFRSFSEKIQNERIYNTIGIKPGRQEGELNMMVRAAGVLGEMTDGFILFEQEDIVGFKSDMLYTPDELIDYRR